MHDELNSMDISKKMIELTTITAFSPMNPAIPMNRKFSNHYSRPHMTSTSDMSNEGAEEHDDIMDDCEDDDDDSRASSNIIEHHDILKSDSSPVANNINLPSPPSSTRSSFDAITRDSFLSNGDLSENNFFSHSSIYVENESNCNSIGQSDLETSLPSSNKVDEDIDNEIKLLIEDMILNLIESSEDGDWKSIQIDFDGETVLPSGLRIVKGVAEMLFYRDDDSEPALRFTNQLNFLKNMLIKYICRYKSAVPFLNPVDSVRLKIPHYYLVIKQPMDLNTVKNRLNFLWYQSASECISDIRQIFKNCFKFNSPTDYVYSAGKKLEEHFETRLKEMPPEEVEIPCPPRPNIEEFQKLNEKKSSKRRNGSITDSIIDQSVLPVHGENVFGVTTYPPIKMTTRSERGVMVRKPSKDLPAPISTPAVKIPVVKKVPLNKPLKECCNFVKELFSKKHAEYAWPFWNPVDTLQYPDYLQKIKKPIDLSTIKTNIETGKYTTVNDFAKDMRLMFSNCLRYNPPESPIIEQVRKLREVFEYRYAQFPEEFLSEKLRIPKNPSSNSSSTSFSVRHHLSASTSHKESDFHHKQTKKAKQSHESKKSSHKTRVSHNESGQMFNSVTDRYNGNSSAYSENVSSENRMKMLEMQVERLTSALTCALMNKGGDQLTASAILGHFGTNDIQNGKSKSTSKSSHKNGYKSKNNKRLSQKPSKKRKHLSSDEEDDSDDDLNNLVDQEPFNPENIDDLKKLKDDLENLQAKDLQSVLRILQSTEPSLQCDDEQNVEIDFEALKPKTLIALRKYVTSCMLTNKASPSNHSNAVNNNSNLSSTKRKRLCHTSPRGSSNFDTDCDISINNNNNWSRADSRASNLQLSESSSDSEMDED